MKEYRNENLHRLALKLVGNPDAAFILRQVEGWQKLSQKVPSWSNIDDLHYPHKLALEQCSGEAAAIYKSEIVKRLFPNGGRRMADLTGGLGVDFSFVARHFESALYVERQEELCELAKHNFPLLKLDNAEIKNADSIEVLETLSDLDLLFLDPARRDGIGRKVVLLEDCEPNVVVLLPNLLAAARIVVLKLSTMLDLRQAISSLAHVSEVHIFAEHGECKDLLLILNRDVAANNEPSIHCVDNGIAFCFTPAEEVNTIANFTSNVGGFLYEPSAAVLKAGAFKIVSQRFQLQKLHPNSHLYVGDKMIENFPGRCFKIKDTCGFSKKELKKCVANTPKANLTVRNFPATVADLRKRLKLAEGGDAYWFATTLHDETHCLIMCEKCSNIN